MSSISQDSSHARAEQQQNGEAYFLAILRMMCYFSVVLFLAIRLVCSDVLPFWNIQKQTHWIRATARRALRIFGITCACDPAQSLELPPGGCVIVANHTSWFDQVCLLAMSERRLSFLAKADYFRIPVLRTILRHLGCVPIDRPLKSTGPSSKMSHQAYRNVSRALLDDNACIVVFPEGTRSTGQQRLHFKSGAFRLAKDTGKPVVAVTIQGAHSVLSKGSALWQARAGHIELRQAEPIFCLPSESPEEFCRRVEFWFDSVLPMESNQSEKSFNRLTV